MWGCFEVLGHGHLFCSALQFELWELVLSRDSEEEDIFHEKREQSLHKSGIRENRMLELASTLLQRTLAAEDYHQSPNLQKAQHTNVCKFALALWKVRSSWEGVLGLSSYQGHEVALVVKQKHASSAPKTNPW